MRLHGKKLQNVTNYFSYLRASASSLFFPFLAVVADVVRLVLCQKYPPSFLLLNSFLTGSARAYNFLSFRKKRTVGRTRLNVRLFFFFGKGICQDRFLKEMDD